MKVTASVTPGLQGIGSREGICLPQTERGDLRAVSVLLRAVSVLLNRPEDIGAGVGNEGHHRAWVSWQRPGRVNGFRIGNAQLGGKGLVLVPHFLWASRIFEI